MQKKHGGLGLVDPEVAQTNLLCKWIIKAMKLGESNLQLMLKFMLVWFKSQQGRSWGMDLSGSLVNNIKASQDPRFGDTLAKPGNYG